MNKRASDRVEGPDRAPYSQFVLGRPANEKSGAQCDLEGVFARTIHKEDLQGNRQVQRAITVQRPADSFVQA